MGRIVYCINPPEHPKGRVVIIDGANNTNSKQFLNSMWEQLDMPYPQWQNWDGYLDWMRDLSWINEKEINIIITNFSLLLKDEIEKKEWVVSDFKNIIFPYFSQEEKEINVYCTG